MYKERKAQLDAGLEAYADKIEQFLALQDFLANDLGLMGQVTNRRNAEGKIEHILKLTDEPASSVHIEKTFEADGSSTEWDVIDLADKWGANNA